MTFRTFSIVVSTVATAVCLVVACVDYQADLYGVYRDVRGRSLAPYDNERMSKYLFSYRYIPDNFDSILIGTSITDNWDTAAISGLLMYNASLNGGNASEESLILRNVLLRTCPVAVLFTIHPYLTETYGRKSGYMYKKEYWAGLGSLQLFQAYYTRWEIERGRQRQEYSPFGQDDFDPPSRPPPSTQGVDASNDHDFALDDRAVHDYGDMVDSARRCGAQIIGVVPPIEHDAWVTHHVAYDHYYAVMRSFFRAQDPVVDMNGPDLDTFRADHANFTDGVHLSREAARRSVAFLDQRLQALGVATIRKAGATQPVPEGPGGH